MWRIHNIVPAIPPDHQVNMKLAIVWGSAGMREAFGSLAVGKQELTHHLLMIRSFLYSRSMDDTVHGNVPAVPPWKMTDRGTA